MNDQITKARDRYKDSVEGNVFSPTESIITKVLVHYGLCSFCIVETNDRRSARLKVRSKVVGDDGGHVVHGMADGPPGVGFWIRGGGYGFVSGSRSLSPVRVVEAASIGRRYLI